MNVFPSPRPLFLAVGLLLAACGSEPRRTVVDSGTAVDAAVTPALDASMVADARTIADAVTLGDGGAGRVACADTSCPAWPVESMNSDQESYCCNVDPVHNPGMISFCVRGNLGTCESGNPFYCDDTADCNAGLHCCNISVRPGLFRCTTDCSGAKLCRSDAECLNGMRCTYRTCAQNVIGTCGPLSDDLARRLSCP